MNRILIVDTRNHTMLVEPGVSFYDVINYFEKNNLPLTMDIPDPAWGSPIGHALERGFAHTYSENGRDRWDTVCGMEVVLGKQVFDDWCGICHGPPDGASGGGTETLAALYRDAELPAQLEDRADLTEELVVTLTREGRNTMPNFRKTEISDSELEALVAYLVEEGEE